MDVDAIATVLSTRRRGVRRKRVNVSIKKKSHDNAEYIGQSPTKRHQQLSRDGSTVDELPVAATSAASSLRATSTVLRLFDDRVPASSVGVST